VLAGNDATLSGPSVTVSGNAAATAGALSVTATAGNASVGGAANAGTDVSITATGAVSAGSVLAGNDATLSGPSVTVSGNAAATAGALSVTATAGNASVGGNATAGTDLSITATGGNAVLGGNATATSGNVSISGENANFTAAGAQTVRADNGSVTITGNATKATGALTLTGERVLVDGSVQVGAGSFFVGATSGDAEITGPTSAGGHAVIHASGVARLGGSVMAGDDLTITAGSIQLFGDLAAGTDRGDTITLDGPVSLHANDSRWSGHGIRVMGTIDGATAGAQTLRLASGDRTILAGGVGNAFRLSQFIVEDGFTQLGTVVGGLLVVDADNFVLAPAARPAGFAVDLASPGRLVLNVGQFTMAQGTKATVLGDFTINAGGGTARLSDINAIGALEVNAGQIVLVTRPSGVALTSIGEQFDIGVDFQSLGGFRFSVVPSVEGSGLVRFGSPQAIGDQLGTLLDFVMINLDDSEFGLNRLTGGFGIVPADFFDGLNFFDLIADGPSTTSNATTVAALSWQEALGAPDAREWGATTWSASMIELPMQGANPFFTLKVQPSPPTQSPDER
jgi:filamentous hemagglutinin